MVSILKVLEEHCDKPLTVYEIMQLSKRAEHKVRDILNSLKKQGFLEVIIDGNQECFFIKKGVRLSETDFVSNDESSFIVWLKKTAHDLIFEKEKSVAPVAQSVSPSSDNRMLQDITLKKTLFRKPEHILGFKPLKTGYKEILLMLITLFILFILFEGYFRYYYNALGKHIAADDDELCFKQMKLDNLPTDTKHGNFVNFIRMGYWEDDPVEGIVPKPNYTQDSIFDINVNGEQKKLVLYASTHHNSQRLNNIEEFSLQKPKGKVRIALFGDSFTCGDEVPLRFGMTYILKELIPNSEVLNFCVSGRGIEAMYARYVIEARKYNPDVVIFNVLTEDLQRAFNCPLHTPNLTITNGHIIIGPRQYPTLRDFYEKYTVPQYESYFLKHVQWVYNQQTGYARRMEKGFKLFSIMLDDMKEQTKQQNSTFIVTIIQWPPNSVNKVLTNYYDKLIQLVQLKSITYLDSLQYFKTKEMSYRNQSFYYIQIGEHGEGPHLGHWSPIGNALYSQRIKNILEELKIINKTNNYYFSNFDQMQVMYFIPEDVNQQLQENIHRFLPFEVRDANYTNNFRLDLAR